MSPTTATTANVATGPANVSYTVTGLDNTKTYDLALFNCANVDTSTAAVKFLHSSNPGGAGNIALQGAIDTESTSISVLNGVAVGDMGGNIKMTDVSPSAGQITFTINSGLAGECIVPVVYSRTDGNDVLNLGTNNQPTDSFGVGGAANFVRLASAGSFGGGGGSWSEPNAVVTDVGTNTFTANDCNGDPNCDGNTYLFESTDTFFDWNGGGTPKSLTYAAFVSKLSADDQVGGNYQPSSTSTFYLENLAPKAPTTVTAAAATPKAGIVVTMSNSATASVASYDVYRAPATQPTTTGQPVTCPTASSAFAKIGSVTDKDASTTASYTFLDATATPPATAGRMNPAYCYNVKAVDVSGDVSAARATTTPTEASKATSATGAPTFIATGNTLATNYAIVVHYSTAAVGAVAANGSDFSVVYFGIDGVGHLLTVSAASATTNAVTITASAAHGAPSAAATGSHVIVTAKTGADGNTVSDNLTVPKFQAVGDKVWVALS